MVLPGLSASSDLRAPSSRGPQSRLGRSPENIMILTGGAQMSGSQNLAAVEVASADHLVVDDHVDSLLAVPLLTLPVVDHWHVDHLRARNIMDFQVQIVNVSIIFQHCRGSLTKRTWENRWGGGF